MDLNSYFDWAEGVFDHPDDRRAAFGFASRIALGGAALFSDELPPIGRDAVETARRYWLDDSADTSKLESMRVECWNYLDRKNGTSTTVEDREDHAVRCLIGCLYAEPSHPDLYMHVHQTLDLLELLGISERELDEIIDEAAQRPSANRFPPQHVTSPTHMCRYGRSLVASERQRGAPCFRCRSTIR